MPEQDPQRRAHNFDEVTLGYTPELARAEADRCLQCKNPSCEGGCPVGVHIRDFIGAILTDDMPASVAWLKKRNALPAVCGRVCPQESQCESQCILAKRGEAVAIGRLERYVADWDRSHSLEERHSAEPAPASGRRVAVIGSGPAGLACAGELAQRGHAVEVFESLHTGGGVLAYGIPEFRLPKAILADEIASLERLGVAFHYNEPVGKITDARELLESEGFDAIFIGIGAGLPLFLEIPGENLNGVYSSNEFLTRVNFMHAANFPTYDTPVWRGHEVMVVGGGNVAMDAARTAVRMGAAQVTLVYRRTEAEMPARAEELHHAKEEGVQVRELCGPIAIEGNTGWVTGLCVQHMELGEPDASGRRRPVAVEGSEEVIPCDTVIIAVGTKAHKQVAEITDVKLTDRGYLATDEDGRTSDPRIYAGGDIVTGAATVILAMGAGKKAAAAIDDFLAKS
ncbi:MAG: NADPH-dependent glutamate synthase [Actinomycetia bacterium]|nr:NADPH-dependent glutamate synthase [Actinomycetes bacterium]